ncbi:TPA: hypothetical protein NHT88_003533 [Providencia rettgeri]|uniref:hypothetical protein n=1 Tax=unclassified Providencia TaxID=2633465 RepID=UPI00234A0F59|nr:MULTISPECIES: hypothetical protein [unclassified Providencia]ELR5140240.1 hypothetical protein [Providencia rettgeri]HCH7937365.1 hypothetical protein [Providencia rettgeri]
MDYANTRKSFNRFIANHLVATAHQVIRTTSQTVIAKSLGVHDSTITRRTEKIPELCETLAAAGVTDFVLPGEKKISEEEYRFLWKQIGELSLMRTKENAPTAGTVEAH